MENENKQEIKNESKIEEGIGWILRIGVAIAVIIMLVGVILLFIHGNTGYKNAIPVNLTLLIKGLKELKAGAWIMIGVFILILTPTIRVFASIFAFLLVKDYLYTAITGLVFCILLFAAFIGLKG
ncbi:DUF1634 domain-containing protein [Oenococcus sp. UCMA 17063]|nr:DUF1634 domain-containing protein [Oenococcus sp. UCMA 17063]